MEALAYGYHLEHGLEVRIARIFNAYGPFMSEGDGRAVPNFIMAALKGEPMAIFGDGHSTRCFQYAKDCVEGLEALMNSDYSSPVNIGSDCEIEISEIAETIAQVVASKLGHRNPVPINLLPAREDDPINRKPDTTVAQTVLGWRPKVSLQEGISTTVDWFLEREGELVSRL